MERGPCAPFSHKTMKGQVYLISYNNSPLITKIGRTKAWANRRKQLKVGDKAIEELVVSCDDMCSLEKKLHQKFKRYRIPGTEWFVLPNSGLKDDIRSDMLICGEQVCPTPAAHKLNEKSDEEQFPEKLDLFHPLNEQLDAFYESWWEELTELTYNNPWVKQFSREWEKGEGLHVWLVYINPRGEEEEMIFYSHELGKIHVQIENWECGIDSKSWHYELMGRNYFDIPLDNSKTIDLVYKNIFGIFEFFETLPEDTWPVRVRARKLAIEQESLEIEAKYGPPLTEEELEAAFKNARRINEGMSELPVSQAEVK